MYERNGFIAALDQSGGSTPKALANYGIDSGRYHNEKEMFALVHKMRSRIIQNKNFCSEHILGANAVGIKEIVAQQFDLAWINISFGLVPIIEPEIDINIVDKIAA